jgi:hypothetical protein
MKKAFFLFTGVIITSAVMAQLKTTTLCPLFVVNILDGRVNELDPNSTIREIKSKLPCFSTAEEETATAKCGGGVFYKDRDIDFFTGRDYVEIREKFKGKFSIPLMGASRNSLFKWLGHPKIKDISWDAFQMSYGTLILYYNKAGKINKLQFSTKSTDALRLCE